MSGGSCSRSMAADTGDGARAPTKNVTAATMKQDKHTALQNACGVIFYSTFFCCSENQPRDHGPHHLPRRRVDGGSGG